MKKKNEQPTQCEFTRRAKEYGAKGISAEDLLKKMADIPTANLNYFYLPSVDLSIEVNVEFTQRQFNAGPLIDYLVGSRSDLNKVVSELDGALHIMLKSWNLEERAAYTEEMAAFETVKEIRDVISKGAGIIDFG